METPMHLQTSIESQKQRIKNMKEQLDLNYTQQIKGLDEQMKTLENVKKRVMQQKYHNNKVIK